MQKPTYLYHHLPKCGGRSFIRACSHWFHTRNERTGRYPTKEQTAEFAKTRLDFDSLPAATLVHGHLVRDGIRPFERYGDHIEAGRCRVLTIVRDPLDRRISAYFHRRRVRNDIAEPADTWLLTRGSNHLARFLGVTAHNWRECLDRYFFVGTTEKLQLSLDVFAAKIQIPPVAAPRLNASPRHRYRPGAELAREFRESNKLDYEIFKYATDLLRRKAQALKIASCVALSCAAPLLKMVLAR